MGGLAQNVQKPPPGKNVPKSQGQIFQECQGQIPKVKWENKNGKNAKVKCGMYGMCGMSGISGMPRSNFPRSNGKIKNGKLEKTGFNRFKLEKWESVTK